jgi:O-acetyl-ADP-ribose deacetylase (regulator of RNase III)
MTYPKYSDNTVFNLKVQTIVNTVNCVGVMGAGIALEYRLRYPEMFEDYLARCKMQKVKTGKPFLYKYPDVWILNFPTKFHWKDPSKIEWIESGLKYLLENYTELGIKSIAFPPLGITHGGLKWDDVKEIMEKYLSKFDIPVYICLDDLKFPRGVEKKMVRALNLLEVDELVSKYKVRRDIAYKIKQNQPFRRFRFLMNVDGVGKKTYERLFRILYDKSKKNQFDSVQTKLIRKSDHYPNF